MPRPKTLSDKQREDHAKRVVIVGMLPTVIRAIATKRNHVLKALSKKTHRLKNFRSSEV